MSVHYRAKRSAQLAPPSQISQGFLRVWAKDTPENADSGAWYLPKNLLNQNLLDKDPKTAFLTSFHNDI